MKKRTIRLWGIRVDQGDQSRKGTWNKPYVEIFQGNLLKDTERPVIHFLIILKSRGRLTYIVAYKDFWSFVVRDLYHLDLGLTTNKGEILSRIDDVR